MFFDVSLLPLLTVWKLIGLLLWSSEEKYWTSITQTFSNQGLSFRKRRIQLFVEEHFQVAACVAKCHNLPRTLHLEWNHTRSQQVLNFYSVHRYPVFSVAMATCRSDACNTVYFLPLANPDTAHRTYWHSIDMCEYIVCTLVQWSA
jgi:hypothetical protein